MTKNENAYDFNKIIKEIDFNSNKLIDINGSFQLTQYQLNILKQRGIEADNYSSLKDLISSLNYLYYVEDEELESVLIQLSERNYYENTNK